MKPCTRKKLKAAGKGCLESVKILLIILSIGVLATGLAVLCSAIFGPLKGFFVHMTLLLLGFVVWQSVAEYRSTECDPEPEDEEEMEG